MKKYRLWNFALVPILLFCAVSCEEEFRPELEKYEDLLVVDGLLTNGSKAIEIKLSASSPVYDKKYIPMPGAKLHLTDQNQAITLFSETVPGIYHPDDTSFRGQVGHTYQLHISLANGKSYISDECMLRSSIPIDSVYGIADEAGSDEEDHDYPGLQFYVENHAQTSDTMYYLWRLAQTYKYRSSFNIDYTWQGELIPYPNPDSLHTCWITTNVGQIIFASTKYLDPTAINRFPLHYVSSDTKLLSIRYSLLVKQLNISENAFDYFRTIEQQNLDQGDLWSKQPVQIRGNIRCVNNAEEPVLGYFIVGGLTEKRIFVNRPELSFYYTECTPDPDLRWLRFEPASSWPIYLDDIMYTGLIVAQSDACFDCRLDGGSITPPDFWVE